MTKIKPRALLDKYINISIFSKVVALCFIASLAFLSIYNTGGGFSTAIKASGVTTGVLLLTHFVIRFRNNLKILISQLIFVFVTVINAGIFVFLNFGDKTPDNQDFIRFLVTSVLIYTVYSNIIAYLVFRLTSGGVFINTLMVSVASFSSSLIGFFFVKNAWIFLLLTTLIPILVLTTRIKRRKDFTTIDYLRGEEFKSLNRELTKFNQSARQIPEELSFLLVTSDRKMILVTATAIGDLRRKKNRLFLGELESSASLSNLVNNTTRMLPKGVSVIHVYTTTSAPLGKNFLPLSIEDKAGRKNVIFLTSHKNIKKNLQKIADFSQVTPISNKQIAATRKAVFGIEDDIRSKNKAVN